MTNIQGITDDYLEKATPKSGEFSKDPDFKDKNGEEKTAEWLYNTFGGNITLLAENKPDGVTNPDYLWNGKLWDLKTPQSINGLDKRVRHGLHQIANNSGGIVVDIKKMNVRIEAIIEKINERINSSAQDNLDVIICKDLVLLKVLRYKK